MPFWIMSLYKGKWNLSQKWCEVSASVLDTLGLASILTMSLIALNRYVKVVKRALYIKLFPSKRFAWLCSGVVWLVSVLIATPPLYGWGKMSYDPDYFHCTFNWKEGHYSYAMLIGGVFNTTTFAIFYCYWKIYQTVKESTDNVNANVAQNGVGAPRFHRTDVKVLKSCFAVVCSFLLTWCPTAISVFVISAGVYIPHEALKVKTVKKYHEHIRRCALGKTTEEVKMKKRKNLRKERKYERRKSDLKGQKETLAYSKLTKEHMSTDYDANNSEEEGGWISRPPSYRSHALNNFFRKLGERSQRAESSVNKRWQRTNSKVGEEADKEPPVGTSKWALNDEWRAHLKQVEEDNDSGQDEADDSGDEQEDRHEESSSEEEIEIV
ncbi:Melanopsin [Stylophora pistillata]|uniref:Melanopsin n=1 Tax=Stylophora pistillata TaxID=50429 RepID=A0A2B4SIC6_STYPI|nr:Melanopsin [Stylophora pistillata]